MLNNQQSYSNDQRNAICAMGPGKRNDILCADEVTIITVLIPQAYLQFCQNLSVHKPSDLVPPLLQEEHVSALVLVLCTQTSSHYSEQMGEGLQFQNCLWVAEHFHH